MVSNGTGQTSWTNWQVSRIKWTAQESEQEERNEEARVH